MRPESDAARPRIEVGERSLQVEFEIEPGAGCPVVSMDDVREVHQRLAEGVCHTDLLIAGDQGAGHVAHIATNVGPDCCCPVFDEFDCIPHIRSREGLLRVRTYLADRETVPEFVSSLRERAVTVRLRRIAESASVESGRETVPISLESLTETQRETLQTAVASGYYATPRRTELADLAAEFDVSKSAISRRLQAAENKLIGELFV